MKHSIPKRITDIFIRAAKNNNFLELSCMQVIKKLEEQDVRHEVPKRKYKTDAISTALNRLVKKGTLEYSTQKTKRGGHIYVVSDWAV